MERRNFKHEGERNELGNKIDYISDKNIYLSKSFSEYIHLQCYNVYNKFELKDIITLKSPGLHLQIKIKTLMLVIECCPYGHILTQSL